MDAHALAAAEPIRLVRNTSFDMRQILSWIDEAMLIITLPKSWTALEDEGITGAIDLAWYYEKYLMEMNAPVVPNDPVVAIPPANFPPPIIEQITELAAVAKMSPANFLAAVRRLFEDKQVGYIWTLYNDFTEYSGAGEN